MSRLRTRTRPPVALALPALLAVAFLLMPLIGILVRTPWGDLGDTSAARAWSRP